MPADVVVSNKEKKRKKENQIPFFSLFVWFWKCCFSGQGRGENWKQTQPTLESLAVHKKYESAKNEETQNNSFTLKLR